MFENLIKKALNDDSEPLQDLINKAIDFNNVKPTGGLKKKSPAVPKMSMPQGSPKDAGTHTAHQINSNLTAVKQAVVTPDGVQQKVVHQAPKDVNIGNAKKPKIGVKPAANEDILGIFSTGVQPGKTQTPHIIPLNDIKAEQQKKKIQYKKHKHGGDVIVGNDESQIPVDLKLDHKARWYHDNLKLGDKVKFWGTNPKEYPQWPGAYAESEVSALNPEGKKLIHLKPIHKDFKDDPNAPPIEVPYHSIHGFRRPVDGNPHKFEHYEYNGEYDTPDPTAPAGAAPEPELTPLQHHEHIQHKQEILKAKTDGLKTHLEPGDPIEFYMRDPMSNKLTLQIGTAHNMQTLGGAEGLNQAKQKKAQGSGGKQSTESINNVIVQTKDGYEDVPLDHVKRFGKYLLKNQPNAMIMFNFNHENGQWEADHPAAQKIQPMSEEGQMGVPSTMAHPETNNVSDNTKQPESSQPLKPSLKDDPDAWWKTQAGQLAPVPQPKGAAEPVPQQGEPTETSIGTENEPVTKPPVSISDMVMDAGGQYLHEDKNDGSVYFMNPKDNKLHKIPADEANPQNLAKILGTVKAENPEEAISDSSHPDFDIREHWTHKAPEPLVAHVRGLLDKIDQYRKKGETVPSDVLAARHSLLQDHDYGKMLGNAATLDNFLANPEALPNIKPPADEKYFAKLLKNNDISSVPLSEAVSKLQGTKAVSPMVASRQSAVYKDLLSQAKETGLTDENLPFDPSKDNRQLLAFYKARLNAEAKKKGMQTINSEIPTEQHVKDMEHLQDLTDFMHSNHLDIPHYQEKLNQLGVILEQNPNSEEVPKLFNELHNYAYERGENDPQHIAHRMLLSLEDLKPKNPEQESTVEQIRGSLENAYRNDNPEKRIQEAMQLAKDSKLKLLMPEKNDYNRSQWDKSKIDNLMEHRKMVESQDELDKQKAADDNQGIIKPPQPYLPNDPGAMDEKSKSVLSRAKAQHAHLKNILGSYMKIIQAVKEDGSRIREGDSTSVVLHKLYNNIHNTANDISSLSKEAAQFGHNIPEIDISDLPKYTDINGQSNKDKEREANQLAGVVGERNRHETKRADWLKREAVFTHNDIQNVRNHFLSRVVNHLPKVQTDLKALDTAVGQKLDEQDFTPISPELATTPQGQQFVNMVNEKIMKLKGREKLVGIPLEEVLGKSVTSIEAEKKLARRDISLALRKAFCNDKESQETQHATELLSAYVDDFIDAINNNYTNIPFDVRKSITRKLLKSLIVDIIRDNEYSASTMNEDFTAPLTETIVKALGKKIASVVTEFRVETGSESMFVVDLTKSARNAVPFIKNTQKLTILHQHQLTKGSANKSVNEWVGILSALEEDMHKSGMLANRISQHRITKFITDNDQKTIREFYNESVDLFTQHVQTLKDNG